ncbi:MAG: THUMP domain-containing protein [Desulfurococcaceae archaeon]
MPSYLITVSGELPLRSRRTRPRFYQVLVENIKDAVSRAGARVLDSRIVEAKILLRTDIDVMDKIARVFGVYRVGHVLVYEFKDLKDLATWIFENAKDAVAGKKFAVRVKRSGHHGFTSLDIAREAGTLLKPLSAGVDLESPDVVVEVEVRGSAAYLYREVLKGPGGLPTGVEGNALVMFSGGFDSPVAAWLAAKRGIQVDFLHYVMGPARSSYYALLVAKTLTYNWLHGYRPRLIVVGFEDLLVEVVKKVEWSYRQVALRALMYIVASRIASKMGYDALVTGESVGQASSQTLKNLSAIERAVELRIPVLRPLIGFDKEEIIELSRRIGLYDLSSKVTEACTIAPTRVATSSTPGEVLKQLENIDKSLVDRAVSSMKIVDVLTARPEEAVLPDAIEIDFIPEGALVLDARSEEERSKSPIPGAIPVNEVDPSRIPRDKVVLFVCDSGSTSYVLAKVFREQGIKAYSLKGGGKEYKR